MGHIYLLTIRGGKVGSPEDNIPDSASGNAQEAREEIEIDSTNFQAINNLGILYLRIGDYDKAIQCFETLQKTRPGDVQALYFLASAYYMAHRNLEEARNIARIVVQAAPVHWAL